MDLNDYYSDLLGMVTNQSNIDIAISQGNNASVCKDAISGQYKVTLPSYTDDKIMMGNASMVDIKMLAGLLKLNPEGLALTVQHFLAYHEAGHIRYSNLDDKPAIDWSLIEDITSTEKATKIFQSRESESIFPMLVNILEDSRIEGKFGIQYPVWLTKMRQINRFMLAIQNDKLTKSAIKTVNQMDKKRIVKKPFDAFMQKAKVAFMDAYKLPIDGHLDGWQNMLKESMAYCGLGKIKFDDLLILANLLLAEYYEKEIFKPEPQNQDQPGDQGEDQQDSQDQGEGETKDKDGQGIKKEQKTKKAGHLGIPSKRRTKQEKEEAIKAMADMIKQSIDGQIEELLNAGIKQSERKCCVNQYTIDAIDGQMQAKLTEKLQKLKASKPSHASKLGLDGDSIDVSAYLAYQVDNEQEKIFQYQPKTRNDYSIVLAIDSSGSMGLTTNEKDIPYYQRKSKMEIAVSATANIASAMEKVDLGISVLEFTNEVTEIKGWQDKVIGTGIGEIKATGDNKIALAVENAISLLKKRTGRKAIIVLSDGEDYTAGQTTDLLKANPDVDLFMAFFCYEPDYFQRLVKAGCTNAIDYVQIDRADELTAGMMQLISKFIKRYQ